MNLNNLNIYQRMAAITANLKTVGKNLTVGWGNSKYKAVSERDILDAVKPLEEEYGVFSYPVSREIIITDTLTKVTKDNSGNEKESTQFLIRIFSRYRFLNVDKPEEYVDIDSIGDGIDSGDKAPGKAMTYADKYALMKAYKISTGDDPDQEASPEAGYKRGNAQKSYVVNAQTCADCGRVIMDTRMNDGGTWKEKDIIAYSQQTFGRRLCVACINKAKAAQQTQGQAKKQ